MSRVIYLAHPIDRVELNSRERSFFQMFIGFLSTALTKNPDHCSVVYRPQQAFDVAEGPATSTFIRDTNMYALDGADALVAVVLHDQKSWGVPAEVERAVCAGKPVVLLTDTDHPTWSMRYSEPNVRMVCVPHLLGPSLEGEGADLAGNYLAQWEDVTQRTTKWLVEQPHPVRGRLPVKQLDARAHIPTRGYSDDAGLDLWVVGDHVVPPGELVDVPCGCAVEIPNYLWGFLVGRSSTFRRKHLQVHPGVIDPGYRGELFAAVHNPGDTPVEVSDGERLAQLILLPNVTPTYDPQWVSQLAPHDRGGNGFGSTGR